MTMNNYKSDFLVLMAMGDAFGMKYEFVEHKVPVGRDDLCYSPHPTFKDYQIGHYTDDTQMSLANAELLLSKETETLIHLDFVKAWLNAFARDPRLGYSRHMLQLLNSNPSPEAFCENINAKKGVTGGAVMRAAPFGLLPNIEKVKYLAREQSVVTHNTPSGITSAQFVALSVHYLHHGGQFEYLENFLDLHLGKNWCSEENGMTEEPTNGLRISFHVFNALKISKSLSDILLAAVSQASIADTDTICAIAMAIASRRSNYLNDLPQNLQDNCENGNYGLSYLRKTDVLLAKKFPRTHQYDQFVP